MTRIEKIHAREVLDSRGNPTVEVDVVLEGGVFGRASVPSGASTGKSEAIELRDGDLMRFQGKGVLRAVRSVNEVIAPKLKGKDATEQESIDDFLCDLDGTENKSLLGANAIVGVSLAIAKAAAAAQGLPLYRWIRQINVATGFMPATEKWLMPMPMINILSGGAHGGRNLDFQDFLIMPIGAKSYGEALLMASEVWHSTRNLLLERGHFPVGLADEGGFGPHLPLNVEAVRILLEAIDRAGYEAGKDIALAVDVASSQFYTDGKYRLTLPPIELNSEEMAELLSDWVKRYPIISIEDGMAEDDWEGWKLLTEMLSERVQLIGDDLFTTNPNRLQEGIERGVANAILIKPNQIGTLTETLHVIQMARDAGYLTVISARSGETEDATIADLAVATNAGQIKIGSLARTERLAKYNQLLRIEEELALSLSKGLGGQAVWQGGAVLGRFIRRDV